MTRIWLAIMLTLASAPLAAASAQDRPEAMLPASETAALDAAVAAMCGKRVALLGDAATHGEGHTEAFKVALVERLVTRCHFDAVFFEASQYDFIEIGRRQRMGQPVTADMLSSAIGGLWKFDREFQPLVPFLLRESNAGRVMLGGLDGQLGSYQAFYSNDAMPDELAGYLTGARATRCRAVFRGLIYGFAGGDPDAADARATMRGCAAEIDRGVVGKRTLTTARCAELRQMLATIDRYMIPDPNEATGFFTARDRNMYAGFRWLAGRLPRSAKIIVWAASVHIARDARFNPAFAAAPNLGSFIGREYGERAFALGITALGGSYRWTKKVYRDLPAAPTGSLEARALASNGTDAAFVDAVSLARFGAIPSGLDRHDYIVSDWSTAFDGVVVLRVQYPPHSSRPGYF